MPLGLLVMMVTQPPRIGTRDYRVNGRDKPGHDGLSMWNTCRPSPRSASCEEIFRAVEPCQGALVAGGGAPRRRALDKAEGSENKARQEVADNIPVRGRPASSYVKHGAKNYTPDARRAGLGEKHRVP